ncbi:histidine utilization repressor [Paludibacterium yongneupense]|uniref:histidine utilization repressor n=1 Tax=Paludibacterium yongneupense TaxID=400061 RepID=UPI000429C1A8|nr:histidine utilization repressor [Paludibacterium yongneupense]
MTVLDVSEARQPRYQRIKQFILDGIRNREYLPGCKIPPELELARLFGVSRMTVNKAIRDLAEAGILLRFAGDGTYVAERKTDSPLLDVNNIAQEIHFRGHNHSTTQHLLCTEAASEEIALRLGMHVGDPVFHSLLVHFEDGVPVQLEDRFVNPAWAPFYMEQDFEQITPNHYLMLHCPLTDLEHSVEAVHANAEEQRLLGIDATEPCLLVLRRSWSHKNLVSYARLTHPGHRYKLRSQTRVSQ